MGTIYPELIGPIQLYYKEASAYLKKYGQHLKPKDRIELNDFSKVVSAIGVFLEFCGEASTDERKKLIELVFELHKCRDEEIEKKSGAHDSHLEAIKFFDAAANAIKFAMNEEPKFAESADIRSLHKWFRGSAPTPAVLEEHKNFQPISKYPDLIFQIVSMTKILKGRTRVKGIYAAVDDLLFGVYPSGLRRSRTIGALDEAYKEGRDRANKIKKNQRT